MGTRGNKKMEMLFRIVSAAASAAITAQQTVNRSDTVNVFYPVLCAPLMNQAVVVVSSFQAAPLCLPASYWCAYNNNPVYKHTFSPLCSQLFLLTFYSCPFRNNDDDDCRRKDVCVCVPVFVAARFLLNSLLPSSISG